MASPVSSTAATAHRVWRPGPLPCSITRTPSLLVPSLCFFIALLEGFDIQAVGVAAPLLIPALGLTPGQAGVVFGAGMVGLVCGALAGGWMADRMGRKFVLPEQSGQGIEQSLVLSAGADGGPNKGGLPEGVAAANDNAFPEQLHKHLPAGTTDVEKDEVGFGRYVMQS